MTTQHTQSTEVVLKASGVVAKYPHATEAALRGIDLTIQAGERVALIGANGSGKSTLLRVMHGRIRPTIGSVWRKHASSEAMLFQKPFLLRASVKWNIALALWVRGMKWSKALIHTQDVLSQQGLIELSQRNASELSGGQQQRVALARALACDPAVLFLDEPTASSDPHAKRMTEALIDDYAPSESHFPHEIDGSISVEKNHTLVFASHNLGQVKRLSSRVVYLEDGLILADLPVKEFFNTNTLAMHYPKAHAFVRGETI